MAIKDVMKSFAEANGTAFAATDEERMLAAAEIEVDGMFDYDRPMVNSNINEA